MKVKFKCVLMISLALCLLLTGCRAKDAEIDRAALGWEEDWTAVGDILAVEPVEDFTANENLDAMSASGLWYATWVTGEAEVRETEQGQRAEIYDAQFYLLIEECKSEAKARAELTVWEDLERKTYDCGDTEPGQYAGQAFSVIPILSAEEDNPYSHGAAALAVRGNYAMSVELMCRDAFEGDPRELLAGFLSGIHYNDKEEQ